MLDTKKIVLRKADNPFTQLLKDLKCGNIPGSSILLLTPKVYENVEAHLESMMGTAKAVRYGVISDQPFSVALSYIEELHLHSVSWIASMHPVGFYLYQQNRNHSASSIYVMCQDGDDLSDVHLEEYFA